MRLRQVLNNLLSNAIKYSEKGQVKLSVKHSTRDGDGDLNLQFIVEDTGQGMSCDDLKKLFSEYSRFNEKFNRTTEGTGIGLNITKKIVELMDGIINVESEYGKGSIFTVTVRQKAVNCGPIGSEIAEQLNNFSFTGGRQFAKLDIQYEDMPYGKVLIVDDVDLNLYVAEEMLSPYKLDVETAISGFMAIEKVKSGKTYDLIFMDHMMPKMDGIETTKKLRAMGFNKTIVALTANALIGNAEMFQENGFDYFLSKPIDAQHLNLVLNKFVREKSQG